MNISRFQFCFIRQINLRFYCLDMQILVTRIIDDKNNTRKECNKMKIYCFYKIYFCEIKHPLVCQYIYLLYLNSHEVMVIGFMTFYAPINEKIKF